jgi:hypothetical protein
MESNYPENTAAKVGRREYFIAATLSPIASKLRVICMGVCVAMSHMSNYRRAKPQSAFNGIVKVTIKVATFAFVESLTFVLVSFEGKAVTLLCAQVHCLVKPIPKYLLC